MQKAFILLTFALVILGFLISTTMNQFQDLRRLEIENQNLSQELNQWRSAYEVVVHERDSIAIEKEGWQAKYESMKQAYEAENQARIKAEAAATFYFEQTNSAIEKTTTAASSPNCASTGTWATNPDAPALSGIIPIGAGSILLIAISCIVVIAISNFRRQRMSNNLDAPRSDSR